MAKTKTIKARVSDDVAQTISELCFYTGKTVSQIVREAIKLYAEDRTRKLAELEAELNKY